MGRNEIQEEKFGQYLIENVLNVNYIHGQGEKNYYSFKDCYFPFEFDIAFGDYFLEKIKGIGISRSQLWVIKSRPIKFKNCKFKKLYNNFTNNQNYEFDAHCEFDEIDFRNANFEGKLKFWNCSFNKTNFINTTFSDLVDFYNCSFKQTVFFFKTDFKGTTVFSASTFKENVLFTYALVEKLIIFRGTKFGTSKKPKGLDLSLALIEGEINCFDIRLNQYRHIVIDEPDENEFEEKYDECITPLKGDLSGEIPIKNKRETFRILKEAFVSRDDISASIKYKALEKETIRQEQKNLLKEIDSKYYIWFKQITQIRLNQISLWLNKYSNEYTSSYGRAIVFILVFGIPLFSISAILSDKYCFVCTDGCLWSWNNFLFSVGDFFTFLSPVHDIDYLDHVTKWKPFFQISDFLGRLIIGYGIYQFVQAFRKYR